MVCKGGCSQYPSVSKSDTPIHHMTCTPCTLDLFVITSCQPAEDANVPLTPLISCSVSLTECIKSFIYQMTWMSAGYVCDKHKDIWVVYQHGFILPLSIYINFNLFTCEIVFCRNRISSSTLCLIMSTRKDNETITLN